MENPLNLGGYKLNVELNNMPVWVILHKADDVTHSQRYRDAFVNSGRFFGKLKTAEI